MKGYNAVRRTARALREYYGVNLGTDTLATCVASSTEAEVLQIPGVGKKTIKLIKAWLVIHHMELYHG
jgi:endonuclease III